MEKAVMVFGVLSIVLSVNGLFHASGRKWLVIFTLVAATVCFAGAIGTGSFIPLVAGWALGLAGQALSGEN